MGYLSVLLGALWLGLLTSISPCPLATNIAAVSFLSRRMDSRRLAVAGALVYALGRALVYTAIGLILMTGLAAAPEVSRTLQTAILPFIGPILILVALVLLNWLPLPVSFGFNNAATASRLARLGLFGELLLGMLFALSFCPVSAALFFGTLLPVGLASSVPLPVFALYGIGTAMPVALIAVAIVLGATSMGPLMSGIQRWQPRLRALTAVAILFIGLWLTFQGALFPD
jgi:cytochrome c-type biogenesis protein